MASGADSTSLLYSSSEHGFLVGYVVGEYLDAYSVSVLVQQGGVDFTPAFCAVLSP